VLKKLTPISSKLVYNMIESIVLPPEREDCSWNGSNDEDFERRLLMHCEAYAQGESVDDTTFDEDDDDERSISCFTMSQIEEEEQNDTPSDEINIVSTVHEENETEIEVTMQRLCESCAMDVTDVTEFVDQYQCPFCMAAQNFDFNYEDDSSSLSQDGKRIYMHVKEQMNTKLLTALTRDGMKGVKKISKKPATTDDKSKNQLLKGMVATFLHQNKQQTSGSLPPESRNDSSSFIKPKAMVNGGRKGYTRTNDDVTSSVRDMNAKMEKYNLYYSDHQRLCELKKLDAPYNMVSSRTIEDADALDVRLQLLQLESYYSKQQLREEYSSGEQGQYCTIPTQRIETSVLKMGQR